MSLSRFQTGDVKAPYRRQKGRKCELEVVPFGEKVMYRLPEVASERHQALEERWAKGIWLGHARHSPEVLIGTAEGIVKSWAIRRLPEGQLWDGIKGSPTNWRLDAGEDSQLVEVYQGIGRCLDEVAKRNKDDGDVGHLLYVGDRILHLS